jgi:hypothetical protein
LAKKNCSTRPSSSSSSQLQSAPPSKSSSSALSSSNGSNVNGNAKKAQGTKWSEEEVGPAFMYRLRLHGLLFHSDLTKNTSSSLARTNPFEGLYESMEPKIGSYCRKVYQIEQKCSACIAGKKS